MDVAMKRVKPRMRVLLATGRICASCRVKRMAPYRLALVGLKGRDTDWKRLCRCPTFDVSYDDHDEEAVVVGVVSVVNPGGDLTSAHDLLQSDQHQFDRHERHALVEEVQRAVEDEVSSIFHGRTAHRRND